MKLPYLKLSRAGSTQRSHLQEWLVEWTLELALRNVGQASTRNVVDRISGALSVRPVAGDPLPAKGQVRLLVPDVLGSRPRYVVLLEVLANDRFRIVPFGLFSYPCVPGEMLTGRCVDVLRVLCLWNSRDITRSTAGRSWFVDTLDDLEMEAAQQVFHHMNEGTDLPSELRERVGPPMWHPFDPRHAYLDGESGAMARLEASGTDPVSYPVKQGPHRLAAEDRPEYGPDDPSTS